MADELRKERLVSPPSETPAEPEDAYEAVEPVEGGGKGAGGREVGGRRGEEGGGQEEATGPVAAPVQERAVPREEISPELKQMRVAFTDAIKEMYAALPPGTADIKGDKKWKQEAAQMFLWIDQAMRGERTKDVFSEHLLYKKLLGLLEQVPGATKLYCKQAATIEAGNIVHLMETFRERSTNQGGL
ncbi:hypothetical protein HYV73_04665 [Candidatus Uhrbacteria bacterium]|nr:hypothetical protein [Candidatus Uhrbacteria bacterium]